MQTVTLNGEQVTLKSTDGKSYTTVAPSDSTLTQRLIAKGVEMMSPPRDIPAWRHRALFFRDPEGNVIEIYAEV